MKGKSVVFFYLPLWSKWSLRQILCFKSHLDNHSLTGYSQSRSTVVLPPARWCQIQTRFYLPCTSRVGDSFLFSHYLCNKFSILNFSFLKYIMRFLFPWLDFDIYIYVPLIHVLICKMELIIITNLQNNF